MLALFVRVFIVEWLDTLQRYKTNLIKQIFFQ